MFELQGETGHRTLWVVFVIMLASSLAMYVMGWRQPANKRLFHVLTSTITTIAAISYYAMAVGDGITLHETVKSKNHLYYSVFREVYWARDVDWALTTPLILIDLTLLAGLNGANITVAVVADIAMVLTTFFGTLTNQGDRARWGYLTLGCLAYLVILYQLIWNGRENIRTRDRKTIVFYTSITGFTIILWTLYPIVWGVSEGAHYIDVDSEILAYAVLDVLTKPFFGFWLLFTHDAMAESSITVEGFWANGLANEGAIRVSDDDE